MFFLSWFYFLTPMDYSPWSEREIWPFLKANKKGAKYPKPEMPCPPKMICIHFTSTSTCMNFLSGFYFLTPMDYSPSSEGKIWLFWRQAKKGQNLRNWRGHAHQYWFPCILCWSLLAWIFWANSILWPPMDYSPWSKGKIWPFWRQTKMGQISETGDTTPTKVGLHAFQTNLCLHEFFEPILFFDPHGPSL